MEGCYGGLLEVEDEVGYRREKEEKEKKFVTFFVYL